MSLRKSIASHNDGPPLTMGDVDVRESEIARVLWLPPPPHRFTSRQAVEDRLEEDRLEQAEGRTSQEIDGDDLDSLFSEYLNIVNRMTDSEIEEELRIINLYVEYVAAEHARIIGSGKFYNPKKLTVNPTATRKLSILTTERDWRAEQVALASKPGPPKLLPFRFDLRLSQHERSALDRISASTKEDRSEIIRRLIREADPAPLQ